MHLSRRTLLTLSPAALYGQGGLTIGQVLDRLQAETKVEWNGPTVDTLKTGARDTRCTGIATTFMATHAVLERAAAQKLNLIITHEPTFYNHLDATKDVETSPVYQAKAALIAKNNLAVFRFHDYWHRMRPDGIQKGMVEALGWQAYQRERQFSLPATSLGELASAMKKKLGAQSIRVIGNAAQKITTVAMMPGAGGSPQQMRLLMAEGVDALVIGETREWETVEYARDAVAQGRAKALIILGHAASEEGGMEYCARWVAGFVKEVPVKFLPAGEPYWPPK